MPMDKKAKTEYMRAWREKNREHDKAYMKAYRDKNREKRKEYYKQWRMDNVEATYAHWNTPRQKKSHAISRWKWFGIRCDDEWDEVYEWYSSKTNCDICDKLFVKSKDKCLDHDHHLEGYNVRAILCSKCNNHRNEL